MIANIPNVSCKCSVCGEEKPNSEYSFYKSRLTKDGFVFAGKTGTSQVKRFTEKQRELEIKNEDLPYEERDHALFVAFAPYKDPRYAISVVIEHGGSGSKSAAPIAKKVIKKVLERHPLRESTRGLGESA